MKIDDPNYKPYEGTVIAREPDHHGGAGKYWKWNMPDDLRTGQFAASQAEYVLYVPGSHPWWWYYALMMVDLRDREGVPPAHKQFPTAEYEIMVWTINPEAPLREPEGNPFEEDANGRILQLLSPPDQIHQLGPFPGGDEDAKKMLELIARACADGFLVPDVDYRQTWNSVLGNTYEHFINPEAHGHGHSHD